MSGVLAVIRPTQDGGIDPGSLELLALARPLGDVAALWLTDGEVPTAELAEHGAARVLRVPLAREHVPLAAAQAAAIAAACDHARPELLLLGPTHAARDLAGRLAATHSVGVVTDVTAVTRTEDGFEVKSTVLGGQWDVTSAIERGTSGSSVPAVVTMAPGAAEAASAPVAAGNVEEIEAPVDLGPVVVLARESGANGERPEPSAARIVVVGGRGVDGDFALVESVADALGGAVGATRVAVDEGWVGHRLQVGQTGAQIAPALYLGLGVSGAIHHTVGMRASRTIVAINTDPDAPIFELADAGIVGDAKSLAPALVAALRARLT